MVGGGGNLAETARSEQSKGRTCVASKLEISGRTLPAAARSAELAVRAEARGLHRRLVDDGKVLWLGSDEDFAVFSRAFSSIDPMIIFIWTTLSDKTVRLNLRIEISDDNRIHYEVYSKSGNAYA